MDTKDKLTEQRQEPEADASPQLTQLLCCPFCGADGIVKKIYGSRDSTDAGLEIGRVATCSNKKCEIKGHVFSIKTWNTRAT
ncbi:hypothetical protein [Gracilimonas sediminicola]|uniref:Uncharacterized protein n=1 Tax=Gracilimonas sediminicola TaxID=2952158 RepID=A0A9X2L0F6_9BACT|nr:hypothetical protein [Gracilimonas sediminicola]MCP9290015.1 hypothetical protein [Gracilimonas sediminicola]